MTDPIMHAKAGTLNQLLDVINVLVDLPLQTRTGDPAQLLFEVHGDHITVQVRGVPNAPIELTPSQQANVEGRRFYCEGGPLNGFWVEAGKPLLAGFDIRDIGKYHNIDAGRLRWLIWEAKS